VLQIGDWHHLKVSIKSADGTSTPDNHCIFYRVVANNDVWALSVNSSGNSSSSSPSSSVFYSTAGF